MKSAKVSRRLLPDWAKLLTFKNSATVEVGTTEMLYDTRWGGGSRNEYFFYDLKAKKAVTFVAVEDERREIPGGMLLITKGTFCGIISPMRIKGAADDIPLLFGLPGADGMPLDVYADRLEEIAGDRFKGGKRKGLEEIAGILRELGGVTNGSNK